MARIIWDYYCGNCGFKQRREGVYPAELGLDAALQKAATKWRCPKCGKPRHGIVGEGAVRFSASGPWTGPLPKPADPGK